jgi:hypothetical protein
MVLRFHQRCWITSFLREAGRVYSPGREQVMGRDPIGAALPGKVGTVVLYHPRPPGGNARRAGWLKPGATEDKGRLRGLHKWSIARAGGLRPHRPPVGGPGGAAVDLTLHRNHGNLVIG